MGANSNFGFASGNGRPFQSASLGLGSNVSTCDTPPCMNKKITRLARGTKCGRRGASGLASLVSAPVDAALAGPVKQPSMAMCPNPHAALNNIRRRDKGPRGSGSSGMALLAIKEFVFTKQALAITLPGRQPPLAFPARARRGRRPVGGEEFGGFGQFAFGGRAAHGQLVRRSQPAQVVGPAVGEQALGEGARLAAHKRAVEQE